MDIKKGLLMVAVGFLFTLVNVNLTYNGSSLNVTPDFVGWILFFLSFDKLGSYISDKQFLKWTSLVMAVLTGATWILGIARPELNIDILNSVLTVVSTVYMFVLFGVLEKIAHDCGSPRESTLRILKWLNLVIYVLFVVAALFYAQGSNDQTALAVAAVLGVALLVCAIITAFVLFRLSKDYTEK